MKIKDYPSYDISNIGIIKNKFNKVLKQQIKNGYFIITLSINNTQKTLYVHRLVGLTYIENNDINKNIINHKDGNKLNNNADNLEWVNQSENTKHAHQNNLIKCYNNPIEKYDLDNNLLEIFPNIQNASDILNIPVSTIRSRVYSNFIQKTYILKIKEKEIINIEDYIDVQNYIGYYKINKQGNVYSIKNKIILKYYLTEDGYHSIILNKDKKGKGYFVHRLIALHFIRENDKSKRFINHKDGNKNNNTIDNLEWCTQSENAKHSVELHNIKVSVIQKTLEGKILNTYKSIIEASDLTKIDGTNISRVCSGQRKTAGNFIWCYNMS